ncbi:MAG: GyrI-like domain-containing protein [Saprospiraceae bacterium]|nr:GyrI-like domain-containing protein [Saprospiraceae bacterium]
MTPRITHIKQKNILGISTSMSVLNNKTGILWQQFGPRIKEIKHRLSSDKISMQLYQPNYFQNFNPQTEFEKWAAVEVSDFNSIPEGIQHTVIPGGDYAVFDYKGSSADASIFHYIYGEWIPNSNYELDDRPHFEVLGEKYRNNDINSEEEIWIPIKKKKDTPIE